MSSPALESYLARLYCDPKALALFLADPEGQSARQGLAPEEQAAMADADLTGLRLAARSYARKRGKRVASLWSRLLGKR